MKKKKKKKTVIFSSRILARQNILEHARIEFISRILSRERNRDKCVASVYSNSGKLIATKRI